MAPLVSWGTLLCAAVGASSGAVVGARALARSLTLREGLVAFGIAALAASLGCVGLGVSGLVGALIGMTIGQIGPIFVRLAIGRPEPS